RAAAAAVSELRPWIERRLRAARAALAEAELARARRAAPGPSVGAARRLVPGPAAPRLHRRGEPLLVPAEEPGAALERFYRRCAREEIAERLDRATALAGSAYTGLDVRAQRTRWASCSASGRMRCHWR